jgi:GNAT superfamily N-acetyltransferase
MKFILKYALSSVNVFERYGVDEYMSALGLLVHPDYRGQGLSVEILKARFDLGKAVGLKATMTFFSPLAAQIAAQKAGMELLAEAFYNDYKEDGEVVFPNIKTKSFKVMGSAM